MRLPSPENLESAPLWENYIVAQATQASLGLIPQHALAVGVQVSGSDVRLVFQLSELNDQDRDDVVEIVAELEGLVGGHVNIEASLELMMESDISPRNGVRWLYISRVSDSEC